MMDEEIEVEEVAQPVSRPMRFSGSNSSANPAEKFASNLKSIDDGMDAEAIIDFYTQPGNSKYFVRKKDADFANAMISVAGKSLAAKYQLQSIRNNSEAVRIRNDLVQETTKEFNELRRVDPIAARELLDDEGNFTYSKKTAVRVGELYKDLVLPAKEKESKDIQPKSARVELPDGTFQDVVYNPQTGSYTPVKAEIDPSAKVINKRESELNALDLKYATDIANLQRDYSGEKAKDSPDSDTLKSIEAKLTTANTQRKDLQSQIKQLRGESPQSKPLSVDQARDFLKQANGDRQKAEQMAKEAGFTF